MKYTVNSEPLYIVSEGTVKNKLMWENGSCRKVIYMGDVQGAQEVNDTCVKTLHAVTIDGGFSVQTL
jgi:hypothetical protein